MSPHARTTLTRTAPTGTALTRTLLLLLAVAAALSLTAAPAEAASSTYGQRALAEARTHAGEPYSYGAAGPDRFDCSGFTQYLLARQGKDLTHSSSGQYAQIAKLAKGSEQPGDLIFTYDASGDIYHVGIYEGDGVMWAATKSGDVVRRQAIWTERYRVGRVT